MNKYRVRGKEIVLKLAQPKYRAPKAARMMQNPQYDPTNYYPQYQDYYSAGAWPAYDVQQQQQQMQQQQPMMVDSRMMMMVSYSIGIVKPRNACIFITSLLICSKDHRKCP